MDYVSVHDERGEAFCALDYTEFTWCAQLVDSAKGERIPGPCLLDTINLYSPILQPEVISQ